MKSSRYRHVAKRRRVSVGRSRSRSSTSSGMRRMRQNFSNASRFVRNLRRKGGKYRKSKRISSEQLVQPDGMGGSSSYKTYKLFGRGIPKGMKAVASSFNYRYNTSGRIEATNGVQNAGITTILLEGTRVIDAMEMLFPGTLAGNLTGLGLIDNCEAETRFTNQSKGNMLMHIYDCVPRKNIEQEDTTLWSPIGTWAQMSVGDTTGTADTVTYTNIGSTPFDSPTFTRFYKITKVTKLIVAQGCCHVHKVRTTGMKTFMKNNEFGVGSDVLTYDRTHTKLTFVVISGFPLNASDDKFSVSTGLVGLDYVTTYRLRLRAFQGSLNRLYYDTTLPVLSTENVMDKGSGEAEANATA